MEKEELLKQLNELVEKSEIYASRPFNIKGDPGDWHEEADNLLLKYINDSEIEETFMKITRWYA